MAETPVVDYFSALERLVAGKPTRVPKDTRITNDAVALEAGRGKGSIKKSRPVFEKLIEAIEQAAAQQAAGLNPDKERLDKAKTTAADYRQQLEAALAREVSLLKEVYELRKQLAQLTNGRVLPIRGR